MILKIPILFEITWKSRDGIDHELLREALIAYFESRDEDFVFRNKIFHNQEVEKFFKSENITALGIPQELVRIISEVKLISREQALKRLK